MDGHPLLRQPVAAVERELGRPDYVERYPRRVDLGYGPRAAPRVEVIFDGTAWALAFFAPGDVDARLGPLLALPPRSLQGAVARAYAGVFRLVRPYRCDAKGCFGIFLGRDGARRLLFGVSRGRRYASLQLTRPP